MEAEKSSDRADPLIGRVIHDRFRIIAPIARGGMGAVYRAEQAPLGRLVALKVLSPDHDVEKDPDFRKRFFLEAATVAKLSHPNTVTVFDYGQTDDQVYFIVMELLEGVTLRNAIRAEAPFEPARALHIAKQICRALREAHQLGLIHRDMKPGNVMLLSQGDEPDYVKVLDFGLVKDVRKADDDTDLTQQGIFMGSPKYMSPEQIQGEKIDGRSDIYAVGVLLYEMLTGRAPFVRDKQVQILMDHIHAPLPPMETPDGAPPVPAEVQRVVERCLAKSPDERFADMDQLLGALKALSGEGGDARSGSFPPPGLATSGAHSVPPSEATGSSGAISVSVPSVSGAVPTGSRGAEPSSAAPATDGTSSDGTSSASAESAGPSPKIAIVAGALVVGALAAVALLTVGPFARGPDASERASLPTEPAVPEPAVPEPAVEPDVAPEPPVPDAPARSLLVELDSRPPGATVRVGDADYGPTPAQVELTGALAEAGRELTFVFAHDGYRETTVTRAVPPEGPLQVSARLRPIGARRRGGAATREEPGQSVTPAGYRESPY